MRKALAIAMLGTFALAALPAPAAASSTYGWSLSCRGTDYGSGYAYWTWMANGVEIGYGSTSCSGDQKTSTSDLTRPEGADGMTVYLFAGYDDGAHIAGDTNYELKSFKVGGSFSFKSSVSYTENGGYGKFQYTMSLTLTG